MRDLLGVFICGSDCLYVVYVIGWYVVWKCFEL